MLTHIGKISKVLLRDYTSIRFLCCASSESDRSPVPWCLVPARAIVIFRAERDGDSQYATLGEELALEDEIRREYPTEGPVAVRE
mmetsp:Transcript_25613/g.78793  ORF Transcript_25613/g.78793 Transcript_25613/m.78793 type:complete len:85 (-) Transcript_25613:439-693(-)